MANPKPCGNPLCPICNPQRPIVVVIADEEPQIWRQTAKGNIVPVFVEDEVKK